MLIAPRSRRTKRVRRALEIPPWLGQHSSAHPRGTIQTWKKLGTVQLRKIRENGELSFPAPSSPRWPRFYICSVGFRVSRRLGCLQHPRSAKTDYADVVADGYGLSHIPEPRSLSKVKCCIGPKLAADSRVVVTARSREPNAGGRPARPWGNAYVCGLRRLLILDENCYPSPSQRKPRRIVNER